MLRRQLSIMPPRLIVAAAENNVSEVRRLLSDGDDVNVKGNGGSDWTPLTKASYHGHVYVVKVLLEHGADIESKDNRGQTPLHWAATYDRLAVVVELLNPNDSNGTTTSILGKRKSRARANIEVKDRKGNTPLHFASLYDHLAIVKALVSAGADILVANDQGLLPIHQAVYRRKSEVSKYLLQHYYATTCRLPLHELLKDIFWIGNHNSISAPPLRYAILKNVLGTDDVVEILEYLIGRDPTWLSSRDEDGLLPLHLACRRGAPFSFVQSLVNKYKASVRSVTPQGDLPLILACEIPKPSLDTIFLLMKLYPDLAYRQV
jgi:ankyrin repeat protein